MLVLNSTFLGLQKITDKMQIFNGWSSFYKTEHGLEKRNTPSKISYFETLLIQIILNCLICVETKIIRELKTETHFYASSSGSSDLFTIDENRSQILRLRSKIKICALGMRPIGCAPEIMRPG